MTRKQALAVIFTAGAEGDVKTFTRTCIENRISMQAARAEYVRGQKFGAFIRQRDCDDCQDRAHAITMPH